MLGSLKAALLFHKNKRTSARFAGAFVAGLIVCLTMATGLATAFAERIADLHPTGYVNDFAGVLSPATRSQLESLCTEVDQKTHAQIAVVTVHTTGDDPIDDYAVRLEEKWKVGPKGSDRGILLLLATDDHQYRFEVGYGLEPILPDGKVGDIGRRMVPYLRQNDYDSAVTLGVESVAQTIATDAHVTLEEDARTTPAHRPQPLRILHDIFLAVVAIVVFFWLLRSGPNGMAGFLLGTLLGSVLGGGGGSGGDDDFGGGGGGGFGGFGGGSSGGGGASGSW
jgi:uncharacterized protein